MQLKNKSESFSTSWPFKVVCLWVPSRAQGVKMGDICSVGNVRAALLISLFLRRLQKWEMATAKMCRNKIGLLRGFALLLQSSNNNFSNILILSLFSITSASSTWLTRGFRNVFVCKNRFQGSSRLKARVEEGLRIQWSFQQCRWSCRTAPVGRVSDPRSVGVVRILRGASRGRGQGGRGLVAGSQ